MAQKTKEVKCKRHRWRVGSSSGAIVDNKIVKTHLNLWCDRCGKWMKAYYNPLGEIITSKMIRNKSYKRAKTSSRRIRR